MFSQVDGGPEAVYDITHHELCSWKTSQIANYQKGILINDTKGKTHMSPLSICRKWHCKIIVTEEVIEAHPVKIVGKTYYRGVTGG